MEIQLIIRASNQNIEDQVINCNSDWTVLKLKNHLSEVYPNKPVVQELKLIYSGRLLHDHLQLKDIIRHEDVQSNIHILHLVWNATHSASSPEQIPSSSQESPNQSTPVQSAQSREENSATSENVLRHRPNYVLPQRNDAQVQMPPQMPAYPLVAYPNDAQMIAHMAAMQQMYAQYVSQYWQSMNIAAAGNVPLVPVVSNIQPPQNNPNNTLHEPAQQPANQRNNVPAVQIEDNEFANRDWLDHVFLYFRFLILLCIIYFYTTPERFMLVIIVVVIAFLYHEGWFVRQGIAEAVMGQRNRVPAEANPNAANNANDQPPSSENEERGQDAHELEAAMDGEDPPHAQNPDAANNNNQVFSPLTFLATFFSSLIPETPPPVNIN